jgi:hypothetical protein
LLPSHRRRLPRTLGVPLFLIAISGGLVSCGGDSTGAGDPSQGTAVAEYIVTDTGTSGETTARRTVSLTVEQSRTNRKL